MLKILSFFFIFLLVILCKYVLYALLFYLIYCFMFNIIILKNFKSNRKSCVIKKSDDIVYARGFLNVQMLELVKLQIEKELIYGKVNYLDNEDKLKQNLEEIGINTSNKETFEEFENRVIKYKKD